MKVQETDTLFTAIAGGAMATIAYLIGGIDNLVNALAIFMILDYGTGWASAFYTNEWDSDVAYRGLAKKSGMIAFVVVSNQLDIVTGNDGGFLRNSMIMFLLGLEGMSIKENCERMGISAPSFFVSALEKLTKKEDKSNKE